MTLAAGREKSWVVEFGVRMSEETVRDREV